MGCEAYQEHDSESGTLQTDDDQASFSKETTDEDQTPRQKALARLFELSGGFGKFSYFALFANQCVVSGFNFLIYGMGFLLQEPDYTCTFTDTA